MSVTPISFLDSSICPVCGAHTLDTFGDMNKSVLNVDKTRIYNAKCTRCKTDFILIWDIDNGSFRAIDKSVAMNNFLTIWRG